MNEIKKSVRGAAASSLLVVIFLIALAINAGKATDTTSFTMGITTFVLACFAIMQWINCVRKYVDFVIGQKMSEVPTGK